MSTKLRRGFAQEIDDVFAEVSVAACGGDPSKIAYQQARIEALRKELWTVIRGLQKQAKGASR